MYSVLKEQLIAVSKNNQIEPIQAFDSFIKSFSTSIINNKASNEDYLFLSHFTSFIKSLTQLFNEEPFVDHLGKLREDFGVKRNPSLTKISDEDLYEVVSAMILKDDLRKRTFKYENCECGLLPLLVMKCMTTKIIDDDLFPEFRRMSYQDSYFLLTDECPVAAFTAYIQIVLSQQAINQKLGSNSISLPFIEIIVGDMSYQVKDHQIAFSTTNRELLEVPFIREKEVYQHDIKIFDLENVSVNDIQCSSDFTSESETKTLMSA